MRIQISDPGWISKRHHQKNSHVSISIGGKKILLASSSYAYSPRTEPFYKANNIKPDCNINLLTIPHGTDDDTREKTLPKFLDAARQISAKLKTNNTVLVNCSHGRSRTGSVVALYLMDYCNLSVDDALRVVSLALEARHYPGGIDIKGLHGESYGQWLRDYKACSDAVQSDENIEENSPEKRITRSIGRARTGLSVAAASSSSEKPLPRKRLTRLFGEPAEKSSFFSRPWPEQSSIAAELPLPEFG